MVNYKRTHTCGELTEAHLDQIVRLSGWVHKRRDLGKLIFIDVRDRFGLTQLIFDPTQLSAEAFEQASSLRHEWVVSITGTVSKRAEGMTNPKLSTGAIEIRVSEVTVLSAAKTPPFEINQEGAAFNEELRLKYRYLDMRRGLIAENLLLRHKAMLLTRNYLSEQGFLEITTPILAKSTPEGARDYLVPSRVFPGTFYALPQSPQIFKQLLMAGGMDRYFQIATCFRDEDLRADRQPEFSQIDIELSFETPETLMDLIEGLMHKLFLECLNTQTALPFQKISYAECMERWGCDRPDLRFGMPLVRLDSIGARSTWGVCLEVLKNGGCIKALCVKQGASLSRKEIDGYIDFVKPLGLQGLSWIKIQPEGPASHIVKFFSSEDLQALISCLEAETGDLILIAAAAETQVNQALDHLRRKIGKERGLIDPRHFCFLWVVDFPLMRWNAEEQRLESEHHPFTSPRVEDLPLMESDPLQVRALAYDLVLNGYEIGGGSQRIHNSHLQEKVFQILQLSPEEITEKFGFFVEALQYGTPPHLGIALGLDRIAMLLCGTDNIREVIAFPKNQRALDLMMQCPSPVPQKQLDELHIKTLT